MRKALITIACALGLGWSAATASALPVDVSEAFYLGYVDPATPASPADELFFVNYLANLDPGEVEAHVNPPNSSYTFSRLNSTLDVALPNAILAGYTRGGGGGPSEVSGFFYLIARYGNVGHVWVLNGLSGSIALPAKLGGGRLNHWTLFRTTPIAVPDGGTTLGLLGLAMLGLGLLRLRTA